MPSTFLSFSGFLKYGAIICRSKPQNEEEAERTEQRSSIKRTTTRMLRGGPPDIARLRGTVDTHKTPAEGWRRGSEYAAEHTREDSGSTVSSMSASAGM